MTRSRTRPLAALLLLTLGVAGCGLHYWSRQGASLDDFNRDSAGCAREANPAYGILIQETYRRCLRGKGWVRAQQREPVPPGWYRGIE
ncbi:MAG TPA: hypothetical protein VIE36_03200 [Methylomirabilota bacterium]